jgi:hypothetical protein
MGYESIRQVHIGEEGKACLAIPCHADAQQLSVIGTAKSGTERYDQWHKGASQVT